MKNSTKALTVVAAIGLLVAMFGLTTVLAQVDVDQEEVAWTMMDGEDLAFVTTRDAPYNLYIVDDALETTKTETVTFDGHASSSIEFDVGGEETRDEDGNDTGGTATFEGTDYEGAETPWVEDSLPTVRVAGRRVSAFVFDEAAGVVTLIDPTEDAVEIKFSYHVQDIYGHGRTPSEPGGETSETTGRARVTSTSDPGGELVEIREVSAVGSQVASATMNIYHGSIMLTGDASAAGANGDGVWIEDGDTVTVAYLNEDGDEIDSDMVTADTVPPTISDISPEDGSVRNSTHPTITFNVTDIGSKIASGDAITIEVMGTDAEDVRSVAYQPISDGFRAIFATNRDWTAQQNFDVPDSDMDGFTWSITAYDVAGNMAVETDSAEVSGDTLDLRIDTNRPQMTGAVTGTAWDTSGTTPEEATGDNTAVKVTFSEILDASSVDASDFTVDGDEPSAATPGTKVDDDNDFRMNVYLTVSELDPDAKPDVQVVDEIEDLAGNELDTDDEQDSERMASDKLSPAITVTVSAALLVEDDEVKVTIDSNEKLSTSAGVAASVQGPASATENGRLNTTSPRPLVHEGSRSASGAVASTGMYGVSIQAKDVATNASNNLTKVTDEEIEITEETGATLTLAKGPIGDANFDGALDGDDVTVTVVGAPGVEVRSVDASARTVTTNMEFGADHIGGVKVTYHYVEDDTFEIDNSAPSVVITPVNEDEVEEAETIFISLDFDEDEYPGDSFKEVWLTKVEIENPDGSTTDLLAAGSFVTSDNMEFIWSAPGLALGDYTLTVMAKDDAGNEMAAQSSMFTVVAREPHEIGLRPGWNLISLPGMPADPDINAVIMEDDVDVVLTYDPAEGAWMVATRGPDGTFSGSLEMVDNTRAYWVHTDTFDPIKVDIPGFQAGSRSVPPEFAVMKGWNLVPVAVLDMESVEDGMLDANDYFTSVDWTRAYGYDNEMNRFESISLGDPDGMVKVGQGYWLHVESDGILAP